MNTMDLTYRKTAFEGASGFGLLIALYDTVAGDLRRAASAQRVGDLEKRAREVKHALAVIGVLENWIDSESGQLAKSLIAFYAGLRRKIIDAQIKQSAEMMEELMAEVLAIREIWQQMDGTSAATGPEILPPVGNQRHSGAFSAQPEQRKLSWSA